MKKEPASFGTDSLTNATEAARIVALVAAFAGCLAMPSAASPSDRDLALNSARAFLPDPGPAQIRIAPTGFSLANSTLEMTWKVEGGRFLPGALIRNGATTELPGESFWISLDDGRVIAAGEMALVEGPREEALEARPEASRMAERFSGRSVSLRLLDAESGLEASWRGFLRDSSNYVRWEVSFKAAKGDLSLREVVLLDVRAPGAQVVGEVEGSPIVLGDLFFGVEHPMSRSSATDAGLRSVVERTVPLRSGQTVRYSAVAGVASPRQMRRAFLNYLERERAHPYRTFLHYNSWYDIGFFSPFEERDCLDVVRVYGRELVEKRDVKMDSFLFDDGWDDTNTVWEFHRGFPRGFIPLKEATKRIGASPGVWLSPWGGYGKPREKRLETGERSGFEVDKQGYALSGPRYFERFRAVTLDMVSRFGINQFKLDGTGSPDKKYPGSEFDSDFEAAIRLIADLRDVRPDLFINLTTGTWPSPFWLRTADSIWRGGWDHSFAGVGTNRQRWITYRDQDTYAGVVKRGPLFPINSLMLHGLIYARHARRLESDPGQDFRSEVRSYFGTGTQLQEMYVTPSKLTPANWDDLAEAARWSRANADVLVDTHWVGGDPGQLEVYGWASWAPRKGILVLRNPSDRPQAFAVDVAALFELPEAAPRVFTIRSPFASDNPRAVFELTAGEPQVLDLDPFEVLVLEAVPRT